LFVTLSLSVFKLSQTYKCSIVQLPPILLELSEVVEPAEKISIQVEKLTFMKVSIRILRVGNYYAVTVTEEFCNHSRSIISCGSTRSIKNSSSAAFLTTKKILMDEVHHKTVDGNFQMESRLGHHRHNIMCEKYFRIKSRMCKY
jgi:hypothetical protein